MGATDAGVQSSLGADGDRDSGFLNGMAGPSISADGRWVVFDSESGNLGLNDTNGSSDVFIHDRLSGTNKLVSVSADASASVGTTPRATSTAVQRRSTSTET